MFSEDAINKFEEEEGCKVNVTYIDNTDTLISKLVEGGSDYDVCDIEAAYVKSFVDNGLIQKMDHSAITNEQYEEFIQYWGITAGCKKTELAQKFINYMISPEAVAMHIDEWGQIPMVQRQYIEEYLPEGFYDNPAIAKYEELEKSRLKSWCRSEAEARSTVPRQSRSECSMMEMHGIL